MMMMILFFDYTDLIDLTMPNSLAIRGLSTQAKNHLATSACAVNE
jgi:hypothetical protein